MMRTKANIGGLPIHPMLVAFPISFYTLSVISFAVYHWFDVSAFWYRMGYLATWAGIATAFLAAIPGFIDWAFAIPADTAAKSRGLLHMTLNGAALVVFLISAYVQRGTWTDVPRTALGPFWLSLLGSVVTLVAGFHGFELVSRHKVGVRLNPQQQILEPDEIFPSRKSGAFEKRTV